MKNRLFSITISFGVLCLFVFSFFSCTHKTSQVRTLQISSRDIAALSIQEARQEVASLQRYIKTTNQQFASKWERLATKENLKYAPPPKNNSRKLRHKTQAMDSPSSSYREEDHIGTAKRNYRTHRGYSPCSTICSASNGICRSALRICAISRHFAHEKMMQFACKKATADCSKAKKTCLHCQKK